MAKSLKETKAQKRITALQQRQMLAEWTLGGRSKEQASKLGIMADIFPTEVSPIEKKNAQLELKAVSNEVVALQEKAITLWKKDKSNAEELGKVLLQIKAVLKHGEFTKWWTKAGFEQNRVSYCLRLAAPDGDKVQAAKERTKKTPRAKAFAVVNDKLAKLYKLSESAKDKEAKELYEEICEEIRERFLKQVVIKIRIPLDVKKAATTA